MWRVQKVASELFQSRGHHNKIYNFDLLVRCPDIYPNSQEYGEENQHLSIY